MRTISLFVILTLFIAASYAQEKAEVIRLAGPPDEVHSTTGPVPPEGTTSGYAIRPSDASKVIADFPAYLWYNGCGPTSAGMVLGYYDGQGFDDLVPGSAATQTAEVDAMISSDGNWNDYCLPLDTFPDILPDKSEPPSGDEHADDCVADFMFCSQSYISMAYGWSRYIHVPGAMDGYVHDMTSYAYLSENLVWGDFTWENYCAEIDANRPVVLLVDTNGNGSTNHFVPAVGYDDSGDMLLYACYDTWNHSIRWEEFAQIAAGQPWGIYGATLFRMNTVTVRHVPSEYTSIQAAIDAALYRDEILVDPGTYIENLDFLGKPILVRSSGGPEVTVIDGNQSGSVVSFTNGEGQDSVLQGFTLTNGTGTVIYMARAGGGVFSKDAAPTIFGNIICNNTVAGNINYGGGIYCDGGDAPMILNNWIMNNTTKKFGGGIYILNSSAVVMNNTIHGNVSNTGGGLMVNSINDPPAITNTILWNNSATTDPEISVQIGNPVFTYCDVKGGWTGEGNIDADPQFVDPGSGDLHLTWTSPCVNRGTAEEAPADDLDGDLRPCMGSVDMGADEFTGDHPLEADVFTVPEAGGTVNLSLDAGTGNGFRGYLVVGSTSGTAPGLALPGGYEMLRVNWDWFSDLEMVLLGTPIFLDFMSVLDAQGLASAQLNVPTLPPGSAGLKMHYAYCCSNPFDFVSNPVEVLVVP
jgi:hypothetical protein